MSIHSGTIMRLYGTDQPDDQVMGCRRRLLYGSNNNSLVNCDFQRLWARPGEESGFMMQFLQAQFSAKVAGFCASRLLKFRRITNRDETLIDD